MATTPNFGGALPTVGGDSGAWGGENNTLHDLWDALIAAAGRSYLAGLTLSTAGGSSSFGVAAGACLDSTNAGGLLLASAYTKTTGSWTVGSGNGALDTGAIANATWYHVHLIKRTDTGVVDILISLSASSPTLPSNYTLFRRIGAMKTDGSAHWTAFSQNGDEFLWKAYPADANTTYSLGSHLVTLGSVPAGVNVQYIATLFGNGGSVSTNTYALMSAPDIGDPGTAGAVNADVAWAGSGFAGTNRVQARTDTSGRVYISVSDNSVGVELSGRGYIDRRGRDA